MGVGRFPSEMAGRGTFLSKSGSEWVAFFENWVGVDRFCQKIDGNGLFSLKNG